MLSQAEYARQRGVSRQRVHQLVQAGRIVLKNKKIDPEQADRALAASDPARALAYELAGDVDGGPELPTGGAGGKTPDEYRVVSTELRMYQRDMARMDRDERAGTLLLATEVEAERYETARAVRDAVLGLSADVAEIVAGMTDPAEVRAYLDRWARNTLEGLRERVRTSDASPSRAGVP